MTTKICGHCAWYRCTNTGGPYCYRTRKTVSYLKTAPDCFAEPGTATGIPSQQTKVCLQCGRELPVSCFDRHSATKDGYQDRCRECLSEANRKAKDKPRDHKKRLPPEPVPEGMKRCGRCGRVLPVAEFWKHKRSLDGLQWNCRDCQGELTKKALQRRRERQRESR